MSCRKVFERLYGDAKARVIRLGEMAETLHGKEEAALLDVIPTADKREEIDEELEHDWTVRQSFSPRKSRTAGDEDHENVDGNASPWTMMNARQSPKNGRQSAKKCTSQAHGSTFKVKINGKIYFKRPVIFLHTLQPTFTFQNPISIFQMSNSEYQINVIFV